MNRILTVSLATVISMCAHAHAFAAPSPYSSQFGALEINNQTSSTLLRDNQNPNLVWVLPPTSGKAEFKGFRPNANIGFCAGLKSLNAASNALIECLEVKPEKNTSGDPLYAIALNYEYPATFTRKVTASYNLFQLYEVMKEQG